MNRRRVWIVGTVLALALAGGLIVALPQLFRKLGSSLPGPGSPVYEKMVSAFFSGVAALDSDANPIARDSLTRATQAVPEEPAAWANLALAQIRLGDLDAAAAALEKAHALAPESGSIENLLALLEERRGRYPEVVAHLERAIEREPKNLKYRYKWFQEIERQGDNDAQSLRILKEILEIAPTNLAVLLDRARLAAKVGDAQALTEVVGLLKEPAASWPPPAHRQFLALEQAVAASNFRLVTTNVLVLRNMLMKTPDYRRSIDAVMLPTGTIGEPLYRFLRLPVPTPTQAPPDTAVAFSVAPLGPNASQVGAVFLLPNPAGGPAIPLEADGRELRKADGSGVIAPFPGGPAAVAASSHGVAAADWNSDYLPDLVLAGAGGLRLLRQKEGGLFDDVTAQTKLAPETLNVDAFGVWTADIELDGDLDFVVGLRTGPTLVLRNQGDGLFEPAQPFAAIVKLRDFAWVDLDHDGDPDAAFLDDQGKLTVLDNERSGRFRPRTTPDTLRAASALAVADLDGDGAMDLILLGPGVIQRLSSREEGAAWEAAEVLRQPEEPAKGAAPPVAGGARLLAADVDNNGGIDFVASGPQGTQVWLDDASGGYRLADAKPALIASAVSDLNGDGRLDLAGLSFEGRAIRAVGSGSKTYRWQVIRPRGAKVFGDGRISSFGIGGEVQVRAGLLVQTQTINGPVVHFGLGEHAGADVARVVWPNGTAQAEFATKADTSIVAEQRLKGSCPFVYAYNGSGIHFVTDFLWRSPLGLRINAQDTAGVSQTEDWVKIRGDQLVPLGPPENEYDIRLTAELWETHYWDHVSLMTVDHPEGTEIFVDERFARKPPALEVHVTSRLRPVVSAFDDKQLDVTDRIRARDGKYLDTFGRGFYQGVTRDHWVEVDVGQEPPAGKKSVLVAEGWIHPTDSSINVALGQGTHAPPQGLVLEVPTSEGKWVAARNDLGFPAGKNKTILIDLDGVFRPGTPRKIRLRTNLEIFWDALSVADVEDRTVLKTQRIAPSLAQLRHRGYSLMTQANLSSPELPRYEILTGRAQRWNDLIGLYTRFGDVSELLEKVDDRYVIVNAGDEVGFRFPAPAPPPSGWVRDFVLIGDGWNKDGDYNTAYSKTVLPLPSHARPAYDTAPGALEDDPVFREHPGDWERYHTRFVTPQVFRGGLRPRPATNP